MIRTIPKLSRIPFIIYFPLAIQYYKIGNGIILRADLHTEKFTSQQQADILKADERNDKPACCREVCPIPENPFNYSMYSDRLLANITAPF